MIAIRRNVFFVLLVAIASVSPPRADRPPQPPTPFAALVARLSEPPGYFDTDNLVSNERSYLHVVPQLRALARQGARGVYVGVGPDQNFSYIAHLRPSLAIVIDIRRENLLLHLLFKALFAEARTRVEYLALLTGRPPPSAIDGWKGRSIADIVSYIDRAAPLGDADRRKAQDRLMRAIAASGVPLPAEDRATIEHFHAQFIAGGLSLQFNTFGRAPQYDYPTFRDLLLEVDREGVRRSYLASDDDFRFLKRLQQEDRVVPIVGDLSGAKALAAVAGYLAQSDLRLAAIYTSNVEFYLFREGRFAPFIDNLRRLPRLPGSVIVRSVFRFGGGAAIPAPGYNSASLTQPIDSLLDGYAAGRFRDYRDLTR